MSGFVCLGRWRWIACNRGGFYCDDWGWCLLWGEEKYDCSVYGRKKRLFMVVKHQICDSMSICENIIWKHNDIIWYTYNITLLVTRIHKYIQNTCGIKKEHVGCGSIGKKLIRVNHLTQMTQPVLKNLPPQIYLLFIDESKFFTVSSLSSNIIKIVITPLPRL